MNRSCRHENPIGSTFCEECGARLEQRCPACGSVCSPAAKFCRACGASLVAGASQTAGDAVARKVVTIVFADLIGSTALHERLDPESVSRLMDRYHRTVRAPVEAHGGTVVQLLGDGVMCAFGVPQVAEDDAIRAVRAAVGIQEAFREFAREHAEALGNLGLRVAVNTGEVVVSDDYAAGIGDPLNVAARLQQEARDGDVLISESTERLVRDRVTLEPFGVFNLKGRAERVAAYRVVSLERPAEASATAFVGRDGELRRLAAVYDEAVTGRRARLAVILGSPGLGKSRLIAECARRLGQRATVLSAQCDAAGGATFTPLADALRTFVGLDDTADADAQCAAIDALVPVDDADRARIAAGVVALLAGTPASPEETFFVIRRFLGALATAQPLVLTIDDLQWAEPLLLDLVEHLVQWSTDVALILLVAARPELREVRSSLAAPGGLVAEVVTLTGLDAGAATRLAASVIGADELPAAVAGRVLAASEGNPLFVGELVRMLVHDGALKREGDRWITAVELAALEMPPTIQALLAARIERLPPDERTVLERAAVVGRQFSRAAVTHLLPGEITDLDARLEALRRSELIEPDAGWFLGEPALRFHHGLTRDAAYRRVLKGTRAELHGRCAEWIESRVGETIEHDETIGWHLEQAHRHLSELGPVDAQGRAFGERASRYLAAAGRRALARDDLPVAANLLRRAIDRLDAADPARADLALDWCEALLAAGDVTTAATAIEELGRFVQPADERLLAVRLSAVRGEDSATTSPNNLAGNTLTPNSQHPNTLRLSAWHTCFAGQLAVLTDPQALRATADAVAAAADELAAAGDAAGEAKAHSVHADALSRLGQVGACEAALDRALAAARRADDRRRSNAVLAGAPLAALWGPSPVARASGRCLDVVRVLRITRGAPAVEAVALRCQGVLEALRGRTDAARRMIASSRRMVEELGLTQGLLETEMSAGLVELIDGDDAAAERSLRTAYEGFRDHGLAIDAARAAALLGRSILPQGRAAEAEALSHESEALAGDDLQAAITWRRVRAEALARSGEHASAVELARAAVDIAAATDALLHHAEARVALAAALRAAGRSDEAAAEEARAIELWEAKGASVLAERARRGAEDRARDTGGRRPSIRLRTGAVGAGADGVDDAHVPDRRAATVRSSLRRVRPNAATAHAARLDAAFAARNLDAVRDLIADGDEIADHSTGVDYDREGGLSSFRLLLRARDPTYRQEPLATLGDTLALFRRSWSFAAFDDDGLSVGATRHAEIVLSEVDADGRRRRFEIFATGRLGHAIARLYERYAEILPDGPERTRAAATAHSVAALLGSRRTLEERLRDRARSLFGPDVEAMDHRTVGFGSVRGKDAVLRVLGALCELSDDVDDRFDDLLDLRPGALLMRWKTSGTVRASGGTFEQDLCMLWIFGADGLATRWEQFDAEQEAEALVRFDELVVSSVERLTAPPPAVRPARRRVRLNAATANVARLDSAMAARDASALPALLADRVESVDHVNRVGYDREGVLAAWHSILNARDLTHRHEPLATLGESLVLSRWVMSASGVRGGNFDVGAYETARIALIEVDGGGRRTRLEYFATERLGDAIARLYERYAELLPEGPERTRAAATARSVAAMVGPWDHRGPVFAPAVEVVDHRILGTWFARGAEAALANVRSVLELADDVANRFDEVLGMQADRLLVRVAQSGTLRSGGGTYERNYLMLNVFATDGLVLYQELFDIGHEAEAVARFDALARHTELGGPIPRRVRPNAATAHAARTDTVIAARDTEALPGLFADEMGAESHITHTAWDRPAVLSSWRSLMLAQDPACRHEPLAILGDSLALCRMSLSASRLARGNFDVGGYEKTEIHLIEVDAQGRRRWTEVFAVERLGDAIVRLYERYAELLPEGPERERAAAIARSVAALPLVGPYDLDRWPYATAVEYLDHRTVGLGAVHGAQALRASVGALLDLAEDFATRTDDVLALRTDRFLVRWTHFGTDRASGGAFERRLCHLWVFGDDGLVVRAEQFDADRDAEALARFDELVPGPAAGLMAETAARQRAALPPPAAEAPRRRVRANAETTNHARVRAAIAARDTDAITVLTARECEIVDHTTGVVYDRQGYLATLRAFFKAEDPTLAVETLATLGDSLALYREKTSASGFVGRTFDVGAYDKVEIVVSEVDRQGRRRRRELFRADRLGDAVVRLYERYAELLPESSERARAAATARSVAVYVGPEDLDRYATTLAPHIDYVDHRIIAMESTQGAETFLRALRSLHEVADDVANRVDDILALRPDAGLLGVTNFGRDRAGGGVYERPFLALSVFGADGLLTRFEQFDVGHEAEALARFDELVGSTAEGSTAGPAPARIENAATRAADRGRAAWEVRDVDRIATALAPEFRQIDRRKMMHLDYGRDEYLEWLRGMSKMRSARFTSRVLATRGERLALRRVLWSGASGSVGPSEVEFVQVDEVDVDGLFAANVTFDPDDLDAAYAELDARYDAGEAAPYAATWEPLAQLLASRDWEKWAALLAPDFVVQDHSPLGWGTLDRTKYLESLKELAALAPDARIRTDHLWVSESRVLGIHVVLGTHEGGAFEQPRVTVSEIDAQGRERRRDIYTLDQLDEARARFAARVPAREGDPLLIPPNAATRAFEHRLEASAAGDWEALEALCAPALVHDDRRRLIRTTFDREMFIAHCKWVAAGGGRAARNVLATAGDRLALVRQCWTAAPNAPPFEIENVSVWEADSEGCLVAVIVFDPHDRRAASAEMLERYARSDTARCIPAAAFEAYRAINDHDLDRLRAALHDDFVFDDRRRTGVGRLEGAEAYLASLRPLYEAAPDFFADNLYDLAIGRHGWLTIGRTSGTFAEGGEFESIFVRLLLYRGDRIAGIEHFELEHLDRARARFDELTNPSVSPLDKGRTKRGAPPARIENAATRAGDRIREAMEAHDWERFAALFPPGFRSIDRQRMALLDADRDRYLEAWRPIFETFSSSSRLTIDPLATRGDRLGLGRVSWMGTGGSVGPSELDWLGIGEVDQNGDLVAEITFDPDDLDAAYAELDERYVAGEAAPFSAVTTGARAFAAAVAARDWDALAAVLAPDLAVYDHRPLGWGTLHGASKLVDTWKSLVDLAADAGLRIDHFTASASGSLAVLTILGTHEGGEFEDVRIVVHEYDGNGRIRRHDIYTLDQLDEARARFETLAEP